MLFGTFDTPWYAWPTTAALVASIFALIGVYMAYRLNYKLRLYDAVANARMKLEEVINLISLATMPCDNFGGQRFISAGGWDELAKKLGMLNAALDAINVYGSKKLRRKGELFFESVQTFHSAVHDAIVTATHTWDSMSQEDQEKQHKAASYLCDILGGKIKPYHDLRKQVLELKGLV